MVYEGSNDVAFFSQFRIFSYEIESISLNDVSTLKYTYTMFANVF